MGSGHTPSSGSVVGGDDREFEDRPAIDSTRPSPPRLAYRGPGEPLLSVRPPPMRGLWIEDGDLRLRDDLPDPEPAAGETLIEVLRAGVCATDLALRAGYMGFSGVPGHEFVGRALDGPLAGRRVVGEINAACGQCEDCRAGNDRHCPARSVLGILGRPGAFAERLALPTRNLLAVPDAVDDDAATFAEPLAAALQIGEQLRVDHLSGPVLVAGDGRLGLLCAHALAHHGARVVVAGRHPEREGLLPDGATWHRGLLETDAPGELVRETFGEDRPFELAVEATGNPDVLPRVLRLVKPRGTVVLKTTAERPVSLDLAPLVVDEQRLLGSRCGRFAPALALLATGRVPVDRFVDARFDLDRGEAALGRAGEPGVLKVLLDVAQSETTS